MKLVIEIDMENEAFQNGRDVMEADRILRDFSGASLKLCKLCQLGGSVSLFDVNGNKVGQAEVRE